VPQALGSGSVEAAKEIFSKAGRRLPWQRRRVKCKFCGDKVQQTKPMQNATPNNSCGAKAIGSKEHAGDEAGKARITYSR
jgi:hypothetical protein